MAVVARPPETAARNDKIEGGTLQQAQKNDHKPAGFACFGELLLRLSAPGNELLLQTGSLAVLIGVA